MKLTFPALLLALVPALPVAGAPRHVTDPGIPRALEVDGTVSVQWGDPARFSEIAHSSNRWEAARGNWVNDLADHLATQAAQRLEADQRLQVTLNDIDRAGDYEPWRGPRMADIRMLRDIYPPRIALSWQLTGADGQALDSGERVLQDPGFLHGGLRLGNRNDALRYEKALIDRWLQQVLPAPARTARR